MKLAIEMFDGDHYVVEIEEPKGEPCPPKDLMFRAIGLQSVALANVVFDMDTGEFFKNRRTRDTWLASYYEILWFQRGNVKQVTAEEFKTVVKILYRNR